MEALLQKLERSLAKMGDIDNESLACVKKKGTSLDPPLYDSRTLFSMFNAGGSSHNRVVDMEKIWSEAQQATCYRPGSKQPEQFLHNKKQNTNLKQSTSRYIKPTKYARRTLQDQISEHKVRTQLLGSSQSSLASHSKPASRIKNMLDNYTTPVSYHGFLAREMRRGWADVGEGTTSGWSREGTTSGGEQQSIAVLKEIYQIR